MNEIETLSKEYRRILDLQQFDVNQLDYKAFERHLPALSLLSQMNNCGITVFDLFKREHIYTSYNFAEIFGYDLDAANKYGNEYFNSRVHPDDLVDLFRNGNLLLEHFFNYPSEKKATWKLVNQYRVLGKEGQYIKIIEQQQALELDPLGNLWLALGVIDIAPDQSDTGRNVISQIYNFKTGQILDWPSPELTDTNSENIVLSKREIEILQYVKEGYLSKEISDRLYISLNTVNTHRQRILRKLGVGNSHEATVFAVKLGLLKSE